MEDVVSTEQMESLTEQAAVVSKMREIVLEVAEPLKDSTRIINMDNYYTSVELLLQLRLSKIYARGTLKGNQSKHFPKSIVLSKKSEKGGLCQAVDRTNGIVAVSWIDGSVVNLVSNADSSDIDFVVRQKKGENACLTLG
jgi:hypothetical protein